MAHVVYTYRPTEMRRLYDLIAWEMYEDRARRHMADMLWIIASDRNLNANVYHSFSETEKEFFSSPFRKETKETGEDIINHLLQR